MWGCLTTFVAPIQMIVNTFVASFRTLRRQAGTERWKQMGVDTRCWYLRTYH